MRFLRDEELEPLVKRANPIITGLPQPPGGKWDGPDSPVQPLSIDLHVGEIYVPLNDPSQSDKVLPLDECVLHSGHTVVVKTMEALRIPPDMAGFGFPPSDVSIKGILMTNPGHVDPGYHGHMHFTVINMGRAEFSVRKGDRIFTLLLVQLDKSVSSDYASRKQGSSGQPDMKGILARLSPDFADVESRATKIVDESVAKANIAVTSLGHKFAFWGTLIAVLITGVFGLVTYSFQNTFFKPAWSDLEHRIIKLESAEGIRDNGQKITELVRRVQQLEKSGKGMPASAQKGKAH